MSDEYVIRINEKEDIPSIDSIEKILMRLPDYFGRVQYPDNIAFEFRSFNNRNPISMPDLVVVCDSRDIVISSNNGHYLREVLAALVIDFVTESKGEHIEVLRP